MSFWSRTFGWWDGQTLNTRFWTWRHGGAVGEDAQGNRFFQTVDGRRRWVIYNGEAEASRISPDWHGWLHHTWDEPPTRAPLPKKPWEAAHQQNLTGTGVAHVPAGSLLRAAPEPRSDYDAWRPE